MRSTSTTSKPGSPLPLVRSPSRPYLVDHSAVDAYAFLIEAEGKRLFYSGDIRSHGRKGILFDDLIQRPVRDIDVLFLEGTMMRRTTTSSLTRR